MKYMHKWLLAVMLACLSISAAHAHLVVSQRGTLNLVGDGAYMVLSLPVSALSGFDDNNDGMLSVKELRAHAVSLESQIQQGVTLISEHGSARLEGVMLNLEPSEIDPTAPTSHLVVLGRFAINPHATGLQLSVRLFGTLGDEKTEQIAVTRGSETQLITLTPEHPQVAVLPSTWATFVEQIRLGANHVLTGADHLLFLLVVLAAAWNLRQVVLALTCFTVGHAITLIACVWYGLSVPSSVVEPAIAATIVGMAIFDRWSQHRGVEHRGNIRLVLVFSCALIHGLGLAGALADLGLQGTGKVLGIAGFNAGIELGQLCVALPALLVMHGVRHLSGPDGLAKTTRLASHIAMALGTFWFLERAVA